jgi:tRNA(adenine34) deaminase
MTDAVFMDMALAEAQAAAKRDEVPVGAVLVSQGGQVLAKNGNRILELKDPTAHAEILVIREAAKALGNERLVGCALYVTLEPCAMCAGAISFARIAMLHFGANDPKGGAVDHGAHFFKQPTCHHRPEVCSGEKWEECSEILKEFFKAKRQAKSKTQ